MAKNKDMEQADFKSRKQALPSAPKNQRKSFRRVDNDGVYTDTKYPHGPSGVKPLPQDRANDSARRPNTGMGGY